jgi:hypothetical protein
LVPAPHVQPQENELPANAWVHVVVVFAGPAGHGVQLEPQVSGELSDTHWLPHRWKPELQVKSQVLKEHTAVPFAGAVQV